MEDGTGGVITARSFMVEKVALAASGAWVGITAACVICSIMTFFAARLPRGLGVGSTTGMGVAALAGAAGERVLEVLRADAEAVAGAVLEGTLATGAETGLTAALTAGLATADFATGLAGAGAAGFATGLTAVFAMVLLTGLTGRVALTAAVFAAVLLGLLDGPAFTGATDLGAEDVFPVLAAGLTTVLAGGFGATLAADLLVAGTLEAVADELALTPAAAGLPFFAVLVAGAFTTGLLSVPDDAWSRGGTSPLAGANGTPSCAGCAGGFVVIPLLRPRF